MVLLQAGLLLPAEVLGLDSPQSHSGGCFLPGVQLMLELFCHALNFWSFWSLGNELEAVSKENEFIPPRKPPQQLQV